MILASFLSQESDVFFQIPEDLGECCLSLFCHLPIQSVLYVIKIIKVEFDLISYGEPCSSTFQVIIPITIIIFSIVIRMSILRN